MISIIVAHDRNLVIGLNNKMPWHYSEDLKYFKKTTENHKVVMGSNTYESILSYLGGPLPNRDTYVLSYDPNHFNEVTVIGSIGDVLEMAKDEEIFICGGRSVYEQFLPFADRLYITLIDKEFEGDTYFPNYDLSQYKEIKRRKLDELTFVVYERK